MDRGAPLPPPIPRRKETLSWALYDWANSAFSTTVMAAFFPIFFKSYWSGGADDTTTNFWLGTTVSITSLVIALLALVLGSIADPEQKALLVTAQKAWLKDRDANVALFAARYASSKGGLFYNLYLVQERTKFLEALLANADGEGEGPTEYMGE